MRRLALAALVVVAGCGGDDDGPTRAQRDAAFDRWVQQADAACERAEAEIVARGEPRDSVDVDRIVVRAADDLRRAAASIRRLRVPPGGEERVRPVLAAIADLEAPLKQIEEWSAVGKDDEVVDAAEEWRHESAALEVAAKDAGLKVCGRSGQADAVADALIAPTFANQHANFEQILLSDVKYVRRNARVTDGASLAKYLEDLSVAFAAGAARYDALEPPSRAANEAGRYHEVLERFAAVTEQEAKTARRRTITPQLVASFDRRFNRVVERAVAAGRRLARALRPRGGVPADPDEEQIEA